jgi:hypothetical protein
VACKQVYFVVSGLKILGHGNPDNSLESPGVLLHVGNDDIDGNSKGSG